MSALHASTAAHVTHSPGIQIAQAQQCQKLWEGRDLLPQGNPHYLTNISGDRKGFIGILLVGEHAWIADFNTEGGEGIQTRAQFASGWLYGKNQIKDHCQIMCLGKRYVGFD